MFGQNRGRNRNFGLSLENCEAIGNMGEEKCKGCYIPTSMTFVRALAGTSCEKPIKYFFPWFEPTLPGSIAGKFTDLPLKSTFFVCLHDRMLKINTQMSNPEGTKLVFILYFVYCFEGQLYVHENKHLIPEIAYLKDENNARL